MQAIPYFGTSNQRIAYYIEVFPVIQISADPAQLFMQLFHFGGSIFSRTVTFTMLYKVCILHISLLYFVGFQLKQIQFYGLSQGL
jgi:hypothetical protein